MHFRGPEAKEYVSTLQPGNQLTLEREADNQFDQNAIKVLTPGGMHIGYIERGQAAWISGWLDEGKTFSVTVESLLAHANNLYPVVTVAEVA
jgi:hypothetical protein